MRIRQAAKSLAHVDVTELTNGRAEPETGATPMPGASLTLATEAALVAQLAACNHRELILETTAALREGESSSSGGCHSGSGAGAAASAAAEARRAADALSKARAAYDKSAYAKFGAKSAPAPPPLPPPLSGLAPAMALATSSSSSGGSAATTDGGVGAATVFASSGTADSVLSSSST